MDRSFDRKSCLLFLALLFAGMLALSCLSPMVADDYSYCFSWVDSGRITAEQAKTSRNRNIITRCVGTYKTVDPDFFEELAAPGSVFILCSDGLTNHVEPEEIREFCLSGYRFREELSSEKEYIFVRSKKLLIRVKGNKLNFPKDTFFLL